LNRSVPELLPTKPTLSPPEHVGQLRTNALPSSVLLLDSASYRVQAPGGGIEHAVEVGLGVAVALGLGVAVAVGLGVAVAVGVGV
jgi:hypothetical protein